MAEQLHCKNCGQPQPAEAPEGLCPVCLAKAALGSETTAQSGTISVSPLAEAAPGTRVAPSPADLAAQFPQLEIIELLGMGGMGMVYKARQTRLDRFVALKILPVDSARGPSFAERFEREAKALAKLNHPGIVAVYDFGQTGRYYYFVMEYVDGMNLRRLLQSHSVEPRQALEVVVQICTSLQYAHDEGIVHRDIKPENILLNKKGQVKIADFGLAKLLNAAPDTALTMSQAAMGTLNYMAPEQRENAQKVDHRADIYSLGVVFYEMLTGEVPMGRFEPPSKRVQVDVRLDEVVLKALEREPARRYQRASEIKTSVEELKAPREKPAGAAPEVFKAKPPPGFTSYVLKRFIIFALAWLAVAWGRRWWLGDTARTLDPVFLLFSLGWAKFVLPAGFVLTVYSWLEARARRGLSLRQLSPPMRHRLLRWSVLMGGGFLIVELVTAWLFFAGPVKGPSLREFRAREQGSREWWFVPNSKAFEKLGLRASFSPPDQNAKRTSGSQPACYVSLIVHRKDFPTAVMSVVLPGLRATYRIPLTNSWDYTSVIDKDTLTDWLRKGAELDPTEPKFEEEVKEIYGLLRAYQNEPPQTTMEFVNLAQAVLREFWFGGYGGGSLSFGGVTWYLLVTLLALEGILYVGCQFWTVRRLYRAAWTEISERRWVPQPRPPAGQAIRRYMLRAGVGTLVLLLALSLGIVVCVREDALGSAAIVALVSLVILSTFLQELHTRLKTLRARERGLWPPLGEIPTIEHVRRLAQAGEKVLAIKLYRQICHVSLKDAKEIVEGLAGSIGREHLG